MHGCVYCLSLQVSLFFLLFLSLTDVKNLTPILTGGAQNLALILTSGKQRPGLDVTSEGGGGTELSDQTTERKLATTAEAPEVFMTQSRGGNGRQAGDPLTSDCI